jgi:hypothetical protein
VPREFVMLTFARAAWAILPITTGNAIGDALDGLGIGPARIAIAMLWAAWAAALVALLAPRPWGLTLLRVVAPLALLFIALTLTSASPLSYAVALTSTVVATALVLSGPIAAAAANALAYGDEVRFPMPIPTPLLVAPVPLATLLAGAGVATGPMLLADGRVVAGFAATAIGVPVVVFVVRSLDALSRRWVVVVPAGVAIVDPLTLVDPVLLRRESVTGMTHAPGRSRPPGVLDLRLGTLRGGVEITLGEPVVFGRREGRAGAALVETRAVGVAAIRVGALLALAASRRIATR